MKKLNVSIKLFFLIIFLCSVTSVQSMEEENFSKNKKASYGTIRENVSLTYPEEIAYTPNRWKVCCTECKDEYCDMSKSCCHLSCAKICSICCMVCFESDCGCAIQ